MADLDSYILHNLQCFSHDNYLVCLPFSGTEFFRSCQVMPFSRVRYNERFRNVYDIAYTVYYL